MLPWSTRARGLSAGLFLPLLFAACGPAPEPPAVPPALGSAQPAPSVATPAPGKVVPGPSGVDLAALDRSVAPCDDFFSFACGGWVKAHPIPDEEASWMRSFSVMREENEKLLKEILEGYASGAGKDEPYAKLLGDFYGSCMDEAAIEAAGTKPLDADLKLVEQAKDVRSLSTVIGKLHKSGTTVFFDYGPEQDFKEASRVIFALHQAGLGMPDREYYLKTDAKALELRAKYTKFVTNVFGLLGENKGKAKQSADDVLAVERALAEISFTKTDLREPQKNYHLVKRADLPTVAPNLGWDRYLAELGMEKTADFNVAQDTYFKGLSALLDGKKLPLAKVRAYLRFHVTRDALSRLPKRFVDEGFAWRQAISGAKNLPPRWKRCVRATDAALPEALGQPFVKRTLGAGGKEAVQKLILAIEGVMKGNLDGLAWMDEPTRKLAQAKLAKIANKIAYPDTFRSYEGLTADRQSYNRSAKAAEAFEIQRQLRKVGQPVDRAEWQMSPPTINAYYDPLLNEMVFPAGILRSPFYSTTVASPANFGGIGMVMGHELTHGFDDEGRQFDADGNMKSWWTPAVDAEFVKRASCVEKQFSAYTVLGDAHVDGKLTLGENLADLGGVKLALMALEKEIGKDAKQAEGEFSPRQQFFLGFAQAWCGSYRDEAMRLLVATNPHSPPQLRVNGPLSNTAAFADAFHCSTGQKMVRSERCEVW
ncbi:MAG: M13 family metallopeptidase [Myxococcales bacterium]|nr:M13 family metallopeptidase [Myxococcales bacterium]MBL0192996.1 M13 family metallopeptidase [Myxococcales bacterium]HQY63993.1 M13 family metallopeptidase [Polyangiaceae bacterium]